MIKMLGFTTDLERIILESPLITKKNIRGLELHGGRENQYQIWGKYYSFENLKRWKKMLLHNQGKKRRQTFSSRKVCQLPLLASYQKERYVMKPFLQYVWGKYLLVFQENLPPTNFGLLLVAIITLGWQTPVSSLLWKSSLRLSKTHKQTIIFLLRK